MGPPTEKVLVMPTASQQRRAIFSLTGPAYLWLLVTILLPLSAMLCFSFLTVSPFSGQQPAWTLEQYRTFFTQDVYMVNAWRSIGLATRVTLLCLLFGYPAAFILARTIKGRWREAMLLLIVLPFWSNGLVRTFSWPMVLTDYGIIGRALHAVWPGAPSIEIMNSYAAILIGLVHAYLPYMVLTCYVALQGINMSLTEAARSLGASHLQVFRRIILPLSLPGVVAGCLLVFVPVLGSFMEPRILGGTQAIMLGTLIENQFTASFNWPLGAALGFVMLGIVFVIMAVFYPLARKHLSVS